MSARIGLLGLVLLGVVGAGVAKADEGAKKGVPDSEIGLRGVSVFETAIPPAVRENTSDPGEEPVPPRVNDEVPPVVPHGVADFLPITRSSNACVDCHAVEEREPGEPTPLPESHYRDLRNAPQVVGEALAGARWVCVSCHVVPTEAKPLVANRFDVARAAGHDSGEDGPNGDGEAAKKNPPVEP